MKPLELWTPSFRARDESQFQAWCEDTGVHRVAPLLRFVTLEVVGAVDWCLLLVPLDLAERCVHAGGQGSFILGWQLIPVSGELLIRGTPFDMVKLLTQWQDLLL